ncbi:hypothetical protein ACFXHA_25625 [Nocardia sp. NPDC059240]|uniref:hypothetical protein n=1 Tax=Nocardia sp. NPDC059240 TaxID=3346786 RepID=UPI00369DE9B5
MRLKILGRNAFGIAAATTVAGLAIGAAPASADIIDLTADCIGYRGTACTAADIEMHFTDATPVWVTLNGTTLGGSPFTPKVFNNSSSMQLILDCHLTPLHIVAMQKDASGTITSQKSTDYTPPVTVPSLIIGDMFTGSALGSADAWLAITGNTTPNTGSALGSSSAADAVKSGSAENGGCHVTDQV